jgi:hypothetical protein
MIKSKKRGQKICRIKKRGLPLHPLSGRGCRTKREVKNWD